MKCESCGHENIEGARFCASCGIALALQNANEGWVGRLIGGRFRITRVLGEGGMGVVYAGEQQMGSTVRRVAIKTLHPHLSRDPAILARFHRECGTVAQLEHPNTIKVYDFGSTEEGTLYIAMEFVEGRSLDKVIEAEGSLAPARVVAILEQVAGALDEAHDLGVVHRDLKPENVVLGARLGNPDFVKVLDFGIAARRESADRQKEQKLTQQGMVLGTPPYMSPEQFTGQELDRRSDVYSLGVMTYEMLTGRLPFQAETAWQWATEHMTAQPYPIEQTPHGADIPRAMREVVLRSLAKRPEDRPKTAGEFVRALEASLQVASGPLSVARTEMMQAAPTGSAQGASTAQAERGSALNARVPTEGALSATQGFELPVKKANRLPLWIGGGVVAALGGAAFFLVQPSGPGEGSGGSAASTPPSTAEPATSPPPLVLTEPPSGGATSVAPASSSGGAPTAGPVLTTPVTPTEVATGSGGKSNAGSKPQGTPEKPPAEPARPKAPECKACSGLASGGQWSQALAAYGACDATGKSQCSKQAKKSGPAQVEAAGGNCQKIRAIVRGLEGMGERLPDRPTLKAALAKCQ
jgi:eukaryotic-like serine/threonine-protein kinase